jgi:pimeloyl-ACP methyl ester carboxylesterase
LAGLRAAKVEPAFVLGVGEWTAASCAGVKELAAVAQKKRPKGVWAMGLSAFQCAIEGRREHVPTSEEYPETVVKRISFESGGGYGWRISGLATPRERPAAWKIVVVTGAPSWAEFWAPTLAALPEDREMIVLDRPGFAHSEPFECVPDIATQAEALLPVLDAAPNQRVLLVGQSYGAAIATLMASKRPTDVAGLVLLSGFFGEAGPTARFWVNVGSKVLGLIPRDLKHATMEVLGQRRQLHPVFELLSLYPLLITFVHGDKDDFAPIEVARRVARTTLVPSKFIEVKGADHFLNDGPAETLLDCLEAAMDPTAPLAQLKPAEPAPARTAKRARARLPSGAAARA